MTEKTITHGVKYLIRITGRLNGVVVDVDETWSCAVRFTQGKFGAAAAFHDGVPVIVDGKFEVEVDTSAEKWEPGIYYYDARVTTPSGAPYWGGRTELVLMPRNSPVS